MAALAAVVPISFPLGPPTPPATTRVELTLRAKLTRLLLRHQIIFWRVLWCQPRFLLVRHFNPHWHFLSCEEDVSLV
jgi:hypothetical protein